MSKSGSDHIVRARSRHFERQHGRCHWCGREMLPPGSVAQIPHKRPPDDLCTLDHLYDRFHPRRREATPGEQRYVAACLECNHKRGRESQAAQPPDELRARAERPPKRFRWRS